MWNLVFGSVRGTSHERTGKPCQDYCTGRAVETPAGVVLIAACADGAGSAEHSDIGARIACETIVEQVSTTLGLSNVAPILESADLVDLNARSRQKVFLEAELLGVPPRDLACTLITAIVGESWAVFTQIGDGAIVFDHEDNYEFGFWPDRGEYANMTRFLTDANWKEHFKFDRIDRKILDLAMLTDGLQMLALNFAGGCVHDRFFRPMFGALREEYRQEALQHSLIGFLDSKRVNDRTDDDKTLLLGTRREPAHHAQSVINVEVD
jgi:hypothetical protein